MTTTRLLALLLVGVAATVIVARRAEVDPAARTFAVTGVVTAPPGGGRVTVAHNDIPGYMPAMTMTFATGPGTPVLAPGDRIRFTLRVSEEWSLAEDIVIGGRDAAVAAAAAVGPSARARLKKGDVVPELRLTGDDGRPFTDADLRGRLTALTFIFTRCPVPEFCPLMVRRFQRLQQEIERDAALRDVRLASVTLDPAFDTPAVLDAYARAKGARPERWRFITGDPAAIARFTKAFAIHAEQNGVFLDHTLATALLDGEGRIVEIWRGNGWTVADVLGALRRGGQR